MDATVWQSSQALLHRLADQSRPAGTGRDLLQLGVLPHPPPHLFPQRLHLRAAGDLHGISSSQIRPPTVATTRARPTGATPCGRFFATSTGDVRSPISTAMSRCHPPCSAGVLPGFAGARGQLPDPGAVLGLLSQQGRLRHRQGRQRRRRVSVRRPGAARCGRAGCTSTRSCSTRSASACCSRCRGPISWSTCRCRPTRAIPPQPDAQQAPRRDLLDAGPRQAGQDHPSTATSFSHLHHSADQFVVAPGIRGLVMLVFTLPSYPYVFKVTQGRLRVEQGG